MPNPVVLAEPLMSCDEVAKFLGVGVSSVKRYRRSRALTAVRIGRYWKFKPDDVRKFIDERTVPARGVGR